MRDLRSGVFMVPPDRWALNVCRGAGDSLGRIASELKSGALSAMVIQIRACALGTR
jgi:hypothetical protein